MPVQDAFFFFFFFELLLVTCEIIAIAPCYLVKVLSFSVKEKRRKFALFLFLWRHLQLHCVWLQINSSSTIPITNHNGMETRALG